MIYKTMINKKGLNNQDNNKEEIRQNRPSYYNPAHFQ